MHLSCRLVCWSLPYHCTSWSSVTQSKVGSEMSGCYSNTPTDMSTEKYRMVKERRGRWVVSVQEWTEDERQSGRRPSQGWSTMKHHSYVEKERQQEQKITKMSIAVRWKMELGYKSIWWRKHRHVESKTETSHEYNLRKRGSLNVMLCNRVSPAKLIWSADSLLLWLKMYFTRFEIHISTQIHTLQDWMNTADIWHADELQIQVNIIT